MTVTELYAVIGMDQGKGGSELITWFEDEEAAKRYVERGHATRDSGRYWDTYHIIKTPTVIP